MWPQINNINMISTYVHLYRFMYKFKFENFIEDSTMKQMPTSEEILRKIEENKNKIKKFGVKRIGLFGSYSKGRQRGESDINIGIRKGRSNP